MDINQIGLLIAYKRSKENVSVEELCEGICSRSFLSRVEMGQRGYEKIVAEALLQRLGFASDRMLYFLNKQEHQWLIVKEKLIEAVNKNDFLNANFYIEEYRKITHKKSRLHKQFLCLAEGILCYKRRTMQKQGMEDILLEVEKKLLEAWNVTRENYAINGVCPRYMSLTEFCIKSLFMYLMEEKGNAIIALQGYQELLYYAETKMDGRDQVKFYPQIVYKYMLLMERIDAPKNDEKESIYQKCIALLKRQGGMILLKELAEYRVKYLRKKQEEIKCSARKIEIEELEEIILIVEWLYHTYQLDDIEWFWQLPFGREEVFSLAETIKSRRKVLGWTQEELAEGICEPVTISRIENEVSNCNREHLGALMDKLCLPSGAAVLSVQIGRVDMYEVVNEISRLIAFSRHVESETLFNKLKDKVIHNRYVDQYLQRQEAMMDYNMKRLDAAGHWTRQKKALHLTVPEKEPEQLEDWVFTRMESMLVNVLSYGCEKIGKGQEMIRWLRVLRNYYERQEFSLYHYMSGYGLTLRNLGNLLGNAGDYEEAIECEDLAIRMSLFVGDTSVLRVLLYDRGWNMEKLWEKKYTKEESRWYIRAALAFNKLYSKPESIARVERKWKENYSDSE